MNSGFLSFSPNYQSVIPRTEFRTPHVYNLPNPSGYLQMRKPVRNHVASDADFNAQAPQDYSPAPYALMGQDDPILDRRHIQILKTPGGTALLGIGVTAPATGGTATNQEVNSGMFVQYATSAVNGNAAGWTFATGFVVYTPNWTTVDFPAVAVFRIRQSGQTAVENIRIWVGLFSADPSASDTPAVHLAGFRYTAPTTTRTNWEIAVNNGGTPQVRGTRFYAPPSTQTTVGDYVMRIEIHGRPISSGAGAHKMIRFFINDQFVGEFRNGNMPGTLLAPLVRVTNVGAGSGRTIWFSRFAYIQR